MKKSILTAIVLTTLSLAKTNAEAREWTLDECLSYAIQNNIQIQKSLISERQGQEDLKQAKAALWPSLNANIHQGVNFRPFPESYTDGSGLTYNISDKVTYQGSYGINANWTIWDGGVNRKNIEAQEIQNELTSLSTSQKQLAIQEQIAQLYTQIMYCQEAGKVNEQLLATAQKQYDRGIQLKQQGQIAKADLAQLEAQVAACQYNVVSSRTQVANFKRQLKALLQLDMNDEFDVAGTIPSDETALEAVPSAQDVYNYALENRPEMRSAILSKQAADLNVEIAKRNFSPSVGLSASLGDSHNSNGHGKQLRTNLNMSAGLTLSVPIWQQRRNITNLNKARLQQINTQLDEADVRSNLSSTIEQYWLNATSQQQNFIAAETRVMSQQASYELLNEQFNAGLKNIVELLEARDALINAQQDKLQSKYSALLNIEMLKLYNGQPIRL